jgi:glycosyltransferase involved in cell wall biosynthesis
VRKIADLLAANGQHEHDQLISVVGNSHFHVPFVELLALTECTVIAHDTRMVEFYMALRGIGGAEEVMMTALDSRGTTLNPTLNDQIDDMRLLQNLGLWEVTRRSKRFISHSVTCRELIKEQTGVFPELLPFANQRVPDGDITQMRRREARERVGFNDSVLHLVSFGYVDIRTKLNDLLIAAAGWLTLWGHSVSLHFAGGASESVSAELHAIATDMGVDDFTITGFLDEDHYQDYLLAADIGLQLRVSDFLGVSGPLSDLAAFGTTSIASEGLARDTNAPAYIHPVPSWISALQLAQEIERVAQTPVDAVEREQERLAYLRSMSPENYVSELLSILAN